MADSAARSAADPEKPLKRGGARAVILLSVAGLFLLAGGLPGRSPLFVWNPSASSPRGLYLLAPGAARTGDYVIARQPAGAEAFAHARGYLPAGAPLVKTVMAGRGDEVCAVGKHLWLNARLVAVRRPADRYGRALPWWRGCRALRADEVLLLGLGDPASFDGRYFGPIATEFVLGRAVLLWRA